MLIESKTKTLPKNSVILGRLPIEVSIIDEVATVEVDTDNPNVKKTKLLTRTDENKTIELSVALTVHDDVAGAEGANSVAKEVTVSLENEVVDTSIVYNWT